jgi:hypothetical protein
MTRSELRVELQGWFCGCGSRGAAAASLLKVLRLHDDFHAKRAEWPWATLAPLVPDEGLRWLLLYTLDSRGYTEHGTSVRGAFLLPLGKALRDALAAEEGDEFEALFGDHCAHGIDIDDDCAGCRAASGEAL